MGTTSVNIDRINYLNIFLVVASVILSYLIPFKLFLFSYTILGPLHYLTEISWLHKSNYFTKGKKDYLILVALGIISYLANFTGIFAGIRGVGTGSILVALLSSFSFLAFEKFKYRMIGVLSAVTLALILGQVNVISKAYFISIAVFLPTIIHVCLFTLLFMIYGSMMGKSKSGYLSCIIFILACVSFFIYTPNITYEVGKTFINPIKHYFPVMSQTLINVFNYDHIPLGTRLNQDHYHSIFFSSAGQMFMRFIAFIYFYHYLNWFSKTSIIKWHAISWEKLIIIVTLWLLSIMVYVMDYGLGFEVLFVLSMMHVFLEFPLNFRTIQTIGNRIFNN